MFSVEILHKLKSHELEIQKSSCQLDNEKEFSAFLPVLIRNFFSRYYKVTGMLENYTFLNFFPNVRQYKSLNCCSV